MASVTNISDRLIRSEAAGGSTDPVEVRFDPSIKSIDYLKMETDWDRITDILEGLDTIRRRRDLYLPQYPGEAPDEYDRRLKSTAWRPEFSNIIETLSSKPFSKDVVVRDTAPESIIGKLDKRTKRRKGGLVDDIDGRGNNLTVFSKQAFTKSVAKGGVAILVDYPQTEVGGTLADDRRNNARPYWLAIDLSHILGCVVEMRGGKEVVTQIRIKETEVVVNGFEETEVDRVRVINPTHWWLFERREDVAKKQMKWFVVDEGVSVRGGQIRNYVPVVFHFTGERTGRYAVKPPLAEIAHMQIELYQALSREDEVLTFAGSPMLTANGMEKGAEDVVVGPKRILYAPPSGEHNGGNTSWEFIQPNAANIKEVRDKSSSIAEEMRRLGMQPLVQKTGGVTATGTAVDAARAHSTVKSWALSFNDAIEQAFVFTTEWMRLSDTIQTKVSTDFWAQPYVQAPLGALKEARSSGDISRVTYWEGLQRFDALPEDFDSTEEEERLSKELSAGEQATDDLDNSPGIDLSNMQNYDDLTEEDLRSVLGDKLYEKAVARRKTTT